MAGIDFEVLAPPRCVINIVFESLELEKHITVEQGFLYYLLESSMPGVNRVFLVGDVHTRLCLQAALD